MINGECVDYRLIKPRADRDLCRDILRNFSNGISRDNTRHVILSSSLYSKTSEVDALQIRAKCIFFLLSLF